MKRHSFVGCAALVALVLGCSRQPVGPNPAPSAASGAPASSPPTRPMASEAGGGASVDAAAPAGIGPAGGVLEAAGAKLTIPPGAVDSERAFEIQRVTGAALADWPKGTEAGFLFTPADTRFRVPATIELPHQDGEGEIICQSRPGERLVLQFDPTPSSKPFPIHVSELPRRCAVYSPEHARAFKAANVREVVQVDKTNRSFRWEIKGKVCNPHELVRPNAGKDLREPPGVGGCPAGMAPVVGKPGVCIDRWEAHVVEVLEDGTEHTWSPYFNPGSLRIRARSAPGAVPQAYISQVQSGEACKVAHKRLCRDDEWVSACRGSKGTQFPYGKDERRGTCNDHREKHPAMQYLESSNLSVFTKLEHPCINQVTDSLLPAGTKQDCKTPEGVADIVGNLHEWTADPTGHFRGGYYVDTWMNGHGCDYLTTAHEARYWDYSTGFRCCADAKDP